VALKNEEYIKDTNEFFDNFMKKSIEILDEQQKVGNLTSEYKAKALISMIANSHELALKASLSKIQVLTATKNLDVIMEKQASKLDADIAFSKTQNTEMINQVKQNALIKAMDAMSSYTESLAQGGLTPDAIMHKNFFLMNKKLLDISGESVDINVNPVPTPKPSDL